MIDIKAVFRGKEPNMDTQDCVITKVIRLPGAAFDSFSGDLLRDRDFIAENNNLMGYSDDGKRQCILVVGEGRKDGILVYSAGYNYARYTALIPNAEAFLLAEQYPVLTEFNKKLADIVEYITGPEASMDYTVDTDRSESPQMRYVVDLEDLGYEFDIDLTHMHIHVMLNTIYEMLQSKPEIKDFELDGEELIIYRDLNSNMLTAESLADPTVALSDMYAYGYTWDGMIPLGKERAIELYEQGHEVFRLYENNAEGAAGSYDDIKTFTGMFGIENPEWKAPEQDMPFQVFIINRERYDKGETAGEWLTLPANADDLQELLERIGVEKPGEGAYTITAVRMPMEDYIRDYISKYDSIDELNMLASFMNDMEDFERDKLRAILSSGVAYIGSDTSALINLLCEDNFTAFDFICVKNEDALGRYYADEHDENPDDVSFEEHGRERVKSEGGKFVGDGYIKHMHKEVGRLYDGVVPDEHKIVHKALAGLRQKVKERGSKEKPSVMEEITASRNSGYKSNDKHRGISGIDTQTNKKRRGEADL